MRTVPWLACLWLLLIGGPLAAQIPGRAAPRDRVQLERQVMERLARQVGRELGLAGEDQTRVRDWLMESNQRRRDLARETAALRREIADAVRRPDTGDAEFERLLGRLHDLRQREVEALRSEERELSEWLSPRQRAELFVRIARFQERLRAIMSRRGPASPR